MTSFSTTDTDIEVHRRELEAGPARSALFRRRYDAEIDDVWRACTDPARLARWYAPVSGDLREGGAFDQGNFGSGIIRVCRAPYEFAADLGGAVPATDRIELRLRTVDGLTEVEFEHITVRDQQEIGGEIYDAVHCMGGGYGPRMITLGEHLGGVLPELDVNLLHTQPAYLEAIMTSMERIDQQLPTIS